MTQFDVILVGAGLVGLSTAVALSARGLSVALIDRMDPETALSPDFDPRASALSASSFVMFEKLGLAQALTPHLQAMNHIVIAEGRVGKVSPLTLQFERGAQDGPSGYMVPNLALRKTLLAAVEVSETIHFFAPAEITQIQRGTAEVTVTLASTSPASTPLASNSASNLGAREQTLTAAVLIACDGRKSRTRTEAGIAMETKAYNQSALVGVIEHSRPHQGTAYEIFYPTGPFALLPLRDNQSALVWSDRPKTLEAARQLPHDALSAEIERRTNGLLGTVTLVTPPLTYPLSLQIAERYTADRLALVGDAAHVIHPIAGQGLNMGLRDAAALTDVLSSAKSAGLDLGGATLSDYGVWRNFDNRTLASATDMLNRLFSNRLPGLGHLRRLGMTLIQGFPAAQQAFTREAAGESGQLPSLLRRD